jgi:hypothetical protein
MLVDLHSIVTLFTDEEEEDEEEEEGFPVNY